MDWEQKIKEGPDRPLPKKGCSIAFYVFLLALALFLLVMYILYRMQS